MVVCNVSILPIYSILLNLCDFTEHFAFYGISKLSGLPISEQSLSTKPIRSIFCQSSIRSSPIDQEADRSQTIRSIPGPFDLLPPPRTNQSFCKSTSCHAYANLNRQTTIRFPPQFSVRRLSLINHQTNIKSMSFASLFRKPSFTIKVIVTDPENSKHFPSPYFNLSLLSHFPIFLFTNETPYICIHTHIRILLPFRQANFYHQSRQEEKKTSCFRLHFKQPPHQHQPAQPEPN